MEAYASVGEYFRLSRDAWPFKILFYISLQKKEKDFYITYVDYSVAVSYFVSMHLLSYQYKNTMSWPVFVSYLSLKRVLKSRSTGQEITAASKYMIEGGHNNYILSKISDKVKPLEIHKIKREAAYKDTLQKTVKNEVEKRYEK